MNSKDYKTYRNILEIKTLPINEAINIKTLEDVKNNPLFKDFDLRKEDLELVLAPKDCIKNYDFYRAISVYDTSVNIADIKGTMHPCYQNRSWLLMLMGLNRSKHSCNIEATIKAIHNLKGNKISLAKYDCYYFIEGDGNHRVCQARFLRLEKVPCVVNEYVLDETLLSLYHQLVSIDGVDIPDNFSHNCYIGQSLPIQYLGLNIDLKFNEHDISILWEIVNKAKVDSRNCLKILINNICLYFDDQSRTSFSIVDKDMSRLYRAILKGLCRK